MRFVCRSLLEEERFPWTQFRYFKKSRSEIARSRKRTTECDYCGEGRGGSEISCG